MTAPAGSRTGTFGGASRKRWAEYFASLPAFRCSDPYIESLYWYRWYVARVNAGGPHETAANAVARSTELRWSGDGASAREAVRRAMEKPGAGDWGAALRALDEAWPDAAFVKEIYPRAAAAAEWLIAERDREGSGLFDLARDDPSLEVRRPAGAGARLKGVDATVHAYLLLRWLEHAAPATRAVRARWKALADITRTAVLERMWNPVTSMFGDLDAKSFSHTGVKHARCFLPYRTDIVTAAHVAGFEEHLFDPGEFWTAFPVPSLAVADTRFSAEGIWRSRRAGEPWNGRTYPAVNAELVDALARVARSHAPHLRGPVATLLRKFAHMMFHDGQLHRVNSHQHYNPVTGRSSAYRGAEDVQHAWFNDLIIRHVVGIDLADGGLSVDPLPFDLEYAELTGVRVHDSTIDVRIDGNSVTVTLNGAATTGELGTPMAFSTPTAN